MEIIDTYVMWVGLQPKGSHLTCMIKSCNPELEIWLFEEVRSKHH